MLIDIWVVYPFWQLWVMLWWTLVYHCVFESLFSGFFWYTPRSRIAGSYGNYTLSFWRTAKLVDILSFWTGGSAFSFGTGLCKLFRWSGLPGLLSDTKESENEVVQLCQTLCNPVDCSPPVSSIHGIFQTRILEWVAISFSRGSSPHRDQTWVSHTTGRLLTVWASRDPIQISKSKAYLNHLSRVWRKGNPLTLLVGMHTSTAAIENSVEIS